MSTKRGGFGPFLPSDSLATTHQSSFSMPKRWVVRVLLLVASVMVWSHALAARTYVIKPEPRWGGGEYRGSSTASLCAIFVGLVAPKMSPINGPYTLDPHVEGSRDCVVRDKFLGMVGSVSVEVIETEDVCRRGNLVTQNFTIGWAKGKVPNTNDWVTSYQPPPAVACIDNCKRSLGDSVECFRSQEAGPNGLYRGSCDFVTTGLGEQCNDPTPPAANPSTPSPACPGTFGFVNGKPVCIDTPAKTMPITPPPSSSASSPARAEPPQVPGNPSAGAKPEAGPGSGSGGVGRTPLVGAGGNDGGGSGATGSALPTSDSPQRDIDVCGLPGKPACRMDESGTPNGSTAMSGAARAWELATAQEVAQVNSVSVTALPWVWGFSLPAGVCSPIEATFSLGSLRLDPCASSGVSLWRALLAYLVGVLTALYIWRSVTSSTGSA